MEKLKSIFLESVIVEAVKRLTVCGVVAVAIILYDHPSKSDRKSVK